MAFSSKYDLYTNINTHICNDNKPSIYMQGLTDNIFMNESPFTMLSCLKTVKQSTKHHPEGSVWNHTMLVLDEAARRKNNASDIQVFMWAALLHDIGKAVTTKSQKGKITAYDHDKAGARMVKNFLEKFEDSNFITKVSVLVRWHMQILYVNKASSFADINSMKLEADINDVALLGLCDRLGRKGIDRQQEEKNINDFLRKVNEHK